MIINLNEDYRIYLQSVVIQLLQIYTDCSKYNQYCNKRRPRSVYNTRIICKKKSIFKYLDEVSVATVTQQELATLRSQLNDREFTVSKMYGFRSTREKTYYDNVSIDDFVIPDFNV